MAKTGFKNNTLRVCCSQLLQLITSNEIEINVIGILNHVKKSLNACSL